MLLSPSRGCQSGEGEGDADGAVHSVALQRSWVQRAPSRAAAWAKQCACGCARSRVQVRECVSGCSRRGRGRQSEINNNAQPRQLGSVDKC